MSLSMAWGMNCNTEIYNTSHWAVPDMDNSMPAVVIEEGQFLKKKISRNISVTYWRTLTLECPCDWTNQEAHLFRRAARFAHTKRMMTVKKRMLESRATKVYWDFSNRNHMTVDPTRMEMDRYFCLQRSTSATAETQTCNSEMPETKKIKFTEKQNSKEMK